METLEAKKVRLLRRWLEREYAGRWLTLSYHLKKATSIITLLAEIEQAYYCQIEEANEQTHCTEDYGTH